MSIELIVFLILLAAGYFLGSAAEARHYRSIEQRERILNKLPAIASKHLPKNIDITETRLVTGNVVISIDYFKRFIASLRNLVGGRVSSYESLIDRARREAILRMKMEAKNMGATMVFNIKMETSSIYKGAKNQIGSVEILAYGTAVKTRNKEPA